MKKSNFDRLLDRYMTGRVSHEERKKIEAWLKLMKAERDTELRLSEADAERLFQRITGSVNSIDDVVALYPRRSRLRKTFSRTWVQVAASVVLLVSISFLLWPVTSADVSPSAKEKLILQDGTLVWLKEGSTFAYYQKDGIRHGELQGEALFEVARVPNSVFTISCGKIRVSVRGTSFNLKEVGDSVELKVLTGRVNVSSSTDTAGVDVDRHQTLVYTLNGAMKVASLKEEEVVGVIAGTQYDMRFSDTRMEEVIVRLEQKFDVNIVVRDRELNDCRVTVDMTDNTLERSLVMITDLLDVTYKRSEKEIELSGHGCK